MVAPPGRKPIADHWRERVRWYAANHPDMSAREIARRLKNEAETANPPRDDWPSERSVRRIRPEVDEPEVRRRYLLANWPDAFGTDALPWESAAAVLELQFHIHRTPEVSLASWYWRLRLRLPDAGLVAALEGEPRQRFAGVLERQRECVAWASAFALAERVPGWPEVVRQRLNEDYVLNLGADRDPMLDSSDMTRLIHGEPILSRDERMARAREGDHGTQG